MHWYGGSIAEAVTLSKQKNAIFVVFVEADNNEQSAEMSSTIDNEVVLHRLADQNNFLAIKLKSGSVNYTHFAQIYQFVPVPSLFFIGRNGTPLEVVCAGVQPDNLAARIDRILAQHHKEKPPTAQPSTSSQNIRAQTTNLLQAEATSAIPVAPKVDSVPAKVDSAPPKVDSAPPKVDSAPPKVDPVPPKDIVAPKKDVSPAKEEAESSAPPAKIQKTSAEYDIVCDGDVCVRKPRQAEPGASTSAQAPSPAQPLEEQPAAGAQESTSDVSMEEKMERAKELIEARRREKMQKEKELEKQKELERRTTGQGVAELKRWQAEQELKHIQEERKREKMENDLARQRILEQIAQDRAERRARETAPAPAHAAHPAATPIPATSGDAQAQARIQLKLPDGSSHAATFSAGDSLRAVQRYVADNLHLSSSNFALWTAFPRRELVEADSTLRELALAPSAALLVLPRRVASSAPRDAASFSVISFITQLITSLIYEPTLQFYTWLRQRLFPPPAVSPTSRTPPASQPPTRPLVPPASPLRRRGNIHRLPGDAQDDDNNTWNGNSTQQM